MRLGPEGQGAACNLITVRPGRIHPSAARQHFRRKVWLQLDSNCVISVGGWSESPASSVQDACVLRSSVVVAAVNHNTGPGVSPGGADGEAARSP